MYVYKTGNLTSHNIYDDESITDIQLDESNQFCSFVEDTAYYLCILIFLQGLGAGSHSITVKPKIKGSIHSLYLPEESVVLPNNSRGCLTLGPYLVAYNDTISREFRLQLKSTNSNDTDVSIQALCLDMSTGEVWDRILTGATHNKPTSAGRMLRELSAVAIRQETAQAGTDTTITFDVGASDKDCIYDRNRVTIVEGTGTGQSRIIIMYDGTTFIAVVDRPWAVIPDNTSIFQIVTGSSETDCLDHGYAVAAAIGSITLKSNSSAVDNFYKDCEIWITAGTGAGQSRLIASYTGENQIALVSSDWLATPDNTSIYHIKYAARKVACSLGPTAKAQVNAEVDTAISDANLGPIIGSGAIKEVFTVTDGTNPIDGVGIWITNDEAGTDVVVGTIYTNANGQATFYLNTGSYYSWKELAGYNFTNPQPFIVST